MVTVVPLLLAFLLLLLFLANSAYAQLKIRNQSEEQRQMANLQRSHFYSFLFLLLTFCVLVGASSSLFLFLKCHSFVLPDGSEEKYLRKDYSIDCHGSRYRNMLPYCFSMITVYPAGIPIMYLVLTRQHETILSDQHKVDAEKAKGSSSSVAHLSFLTNAYKPKFYWYEVLECLRRLTLASIIGIVSDEASAAPLMALLISGAFTWASTTLRPFKNTSDNVSVVLLNNFESTTFTAHTVLSVWLHDSSMRLTSPSNSDAGSRARLCSRELLFIGAPD